MKVFGLIGEELSYSFSPKYFKEKFDRESLRGLYLPFEISSESYLPSFLSWASHAIAGMNVTIPYKEKVIPLLHQMSEAAQIIGAVNCIEVADSGQLIGHNTDYIGFLEPLKRFLKNNSIKKTLVLGTGGASKAVVYALNENGIEVQLVSRLKELNVWNYDDLNHQDIGAFDLIVNTTPLGMTRFLDEMPPIDMSQLDSRHIVYDLIYNPSKTLFLTKAEEQGANIINGEAMLISQAEASWEIWQKSLRKSC